MFTQLSTIGLVGPLGAVAAQFLAAPRLRLEERATRGCNRIATTRARGFGARAHVLVDVTGQRKGKAQDETRGLHADI